MDSNLGKISTLCGYATACVVYWLASLSMGHWSTCPVNFPHSLFPGLSRRLKAVHQNCRCSGIEYWPSCPLKIRTTRAIRVRKAVEILLSS